MFQNLGQVQQSSNRQLKEGIPVGSLRITRLIFRKILHKVIKDASDAFIRWSTECQVVSKLADSKARVLFDHAGNQGYVDCSLLIAADGANGKIREVHRPSDCLEYTDAVLRGGLLDSRGPPFTAG